MKLAMKGIDPDEIAKAMAEASPAISLRYSSKAVL
ncbi:hypothetical protein [Aeromonas caviae]